VTVLDSDQEPRRYFFVHMQKTAGMALRQRLINHFGEPAVYPTRGVDGTDPVELVLSVDHLRERLAVRGDQIRVITGHFPLCTTELLDGGFTTLTLLREPVERTLSYLRHHGENERVDRHKSLEEIYDDPFRFHGLAHNHMTKMLSLTPAEMTDGMLTRVEFDSDRLERAKEALAGIDAVGLQERFEVFCDELSARFGWRLGEAEIVNASVPVDVSEGFRARIAEDNALDIELYEFARQLVASRDDHRALEVVGGRPMTSSAGDGPLISVVIPTYQRAPLLERSLESLTAQALGRSRFEVVVVDDGSSDWTASVCERLSEELPLRYLRIEKAGTSAAKNLGLFASQAPLVLFYDDDDLADPGMLEAYIAAHRAHPQENVAVLGYTTWAPELELTPLMEYVTEIGQYLFSYVNIEDGAMLDYTRFWAGRISCKRSFLAQHGIFDQDFEAIEDVELGFRLAQHGLAVVHARSARSLMARSITFDEFARRCVKHGRGLWLFHKRHEEPAVERYCRIGEALEKWPSLAPSVEAKMERARELERRHSEEGGLEENDLTELRELYRWTFDALRMRGIAEAEAEASEPASRHLHAVTSAAARVPAICPEPVFIIGSPRSGTSIVAWSLAEHSELWTEAESDILYYLLKDGHLERAFETSVARPDGTWLANHGVDLERFLAYLGLGLNALLTATSNGRRWVDQTPANTLVVDRIAEMFPGARFLHILRDGRRVVHSMVNFHRVFDDPETAERMKSAGRLPPWTADFRDACRAWARFTRIASDFCQRHPDRAFTVTNERLITDPDEAMREVLEFLDLRQEPAPARFLRTNRINSSFAVSGKSVDSPPALTEPWREWPPEQRLAFFEEAGETMAACGLATEAELLAGSASTEGSPRTGNGDGRARGGVPLTGYDRP
jgi:glycosyltransferase involved in cell wall biosynthesis